MYAGDFDLYADPTDGKGYLIFGRPHTEMIIADLSNDYMNVTGHYTQHFPHPGPITSREAPCLFRKGGSFFIITSGTTGYFPNPSEAAVADIIHGPWKVLGNPCNNDEYTQCDTKATIDRLHLLFYVYILRIWRYGCCSFRRI